MSLVPARRRDTPFSPDDAGVCDALLTAGLIFAGPGSPTYAARQLRNSLAWHRTVARIGMGAAAVFASAAAIAVGRYALPVYEIYKAGEDLHWQAGLDLLGPFGLSLVIFPHWNNNDGGAELDTSRCFMGQSRFSQLHDMLPAGVCVVGLDEHTGLILDVVRGEGRVLGQGCVTVLAGETEACFQDGESFPLRRMGAFRPADMLSTVPGDVLAEVIAAAPKESEGERVSVPEKVLELAEARQVARTRRDWTAADRLRTKIEALGWQVQDTTAGPRVVPGSTQR